MINLNKNKNKGFTLIEMLVALAVFSIIVISMSNTAFLVIKGQRKAFALQLTQESSRYILESMIKEIRMSVIDSDNGSGLLTLNITNSKEESVVYQFINNKIQRNEQDLSSDNIELTGSFYVRTSPSPNRALVTVVMKIKSTGVKIEEQAEIYIQNSITSRSN